MDVELCTLDCAWRGLAVSTVTATLILPLLLLSLRLLKGRMSQQQSKWYMNFHFAILSVILTGGFVFVAVADPELASRCFARFAKMEDSLSWTRILSGVWLGCTMLLLSLDALRTWTAFRRTRALKPCKDLQIQNLLRECASRLRAPTNIKLLLGPGHFSPFALGVNTIVLPERMVDSSSESLRGVFCHELVHLRDRDGLWMLAELFCRRLLFFHPLMHILSREYAITVERAADEEAVRLGGVRPDSLLNTLLEIVESLVLEKPVAFKLGATRGYQEMKLRLESLMQMGERRGASTSLFLALAGFSLVTSVGISLAQAATRPNENMCTQLNQEKIIESWLSDLGPQSCRQERPLKNKCGGEK